MKEESRKKTNTALFILIATILNVVLMIGFMIVGFVLLGKFGDPESNLNTLWLFMIFAGSVALSWFIYNRLIKWYTRRVDMEKNFAPVFAPRKNRPRKNDAGKKETGKNVKE